MRKLIVSLTFLCLGARVLGVAQPSNGEGESCYSYAGGTVYPQDKDYVQSDHKLQWTKALSKYSHP